MKKSIDLPHADAEPASLDLARAIWTLGSNLLITTNYDRVLDWGCPQPLDLARLDNSAPAELAALMRGDISKPTVWHLHGRIDNVDRLVLTPDGYRQLYLSKDLEVSYPAALETLRQQMATRTLLFIGFSLDDMFLGMQLEGVFKLFGGYTPPAYALIRRSEIERVAAKGLPVELVPYDDHGPPLLALVRELADLAAPAPPASGAGSALSPAGERMPRVAGDPGRAPGRGARKSLAHLLPLIEDAEVPWSRPIAAMDKDIGQAKGFVVLGWRKGGRKAFLRQVVAHLRRAQPRWDVISLSTSPGYGEDVNAYMARMRATLEDPMHTGERLVACIHGWPSPGRQDAMAAHLAALADQLRVYMDDKSRQFTMVAVGGYGLYLLRYEGGNVSPLNTAHQVDLPDFTAADVAALMQQVAPSPWLPLCACGLLGAASRGVSRPSIAHTQPG